jgi:hypothetical protein
MSRQYKRARTAAIAVVDGLSKVKIEGQDLGLRCLNVAELSRALSEIFDQPLNEHTVRYWVRTHRAKKR